MLISADWTCIMVDEVLNHARYMLRAVLRDQGETTEYIDLISKKFDELVKDEYRYILREVDNSGSSL